MHGITCLFSETSLKQLLVFCFASVLVIALNGCPSSEPKGKDAEMLTAAKQVAKLIDEYYREFAEYPETISQVRPLLPPAVKWPVNPYNGDEITDTGSREFDPANSPGNIFYEKIYRDEQMVNYQLHIFGEKGKIYILGNTAMGAKE